MNPKILLVPVLFLFLSSSEAQRVVRKGMKHETEKIELPLSLYTINQLNGKWQEFARTDLKGRNTVFADTLLLSVNNGRGTIKEATGMKMAMLGEAFVEAPASLNIAGDIYTIKNLGKDLIILEDDTFLHSMKKVSRFFHETVGKDSVKQPSYQIKQQIQFESLQGKWQVYRRQAEAGFINEKTILIKSLSFISFLNESNAKGEIVTYSGNNISEIHPCSIEFSNGRMSIITAKGTSFFNVYKADNNDLIFGNEGELMNYAKK